ncbi:hypothetical protein GCM10011612_03820 [Actinomyces gaoshouyii]|uniref:Tetratricopeptide repeat protein n=2 Tax=Actinomyces gaoshouyii TaxID=1960083 RepID=A0A8H9HBX3_9ACTO|nr:hypothetical protein GCM10011612_03820 [Actinomyces gaoshouyii]
MGARKPMPRRRRLLIGLGLTSMLLVVGLWFAAVSTGTTLANRSLYVGDYSAAVDRYRMVRTINPWLHKWRVRYNLGTAEVLAGDYDRSIADLESSLPDAPQEVIDIAYDTEGNVIRQRTGVCMTRINLFVAHMALAGQAQESGDMTAAQAQVDAAKEAAGDCEVPPVQSPQSQPTTPPTQTPTPTAPPTQTPSASGSLSPDASQSPSSDPSTNPSASGSSLPTAEPTSSGPSAPTPGKSGSAGPTPTEGQEKEKRLQRRNQGREGRTAGPNDGAKRRW